MRLIVAVLDSTVSLYQGHCTAIDVQAAAGRCRLDSTVSLERVSAP